MAATSVRPNEIENCLLLSDCRISLTTIGLIRSVPQSHTRSQPFRAIGRCDVRKRLLPKRPMTSSIDRPVRSGSLHGPVVICKKTSSSDRLSVPYSRTGKPAEIIALTRFACSASSLVANWKRTVRSSAWTCETFSFDASHWPRASPRLIN